MDEFAFPHFQDWGTGLVVKFIDNVVSGVLIVSKLVRDGELGGS